MLLVVYDSCPGEAGSFMVSATTGGYAGGQYGADESYFVIDDNDMLLTTEHEKCMHSIAWTRAFGKSRVFCFQSGHDNVTCVQRTVLHQDRCGCAKGSLQPPLQD